MQGDCYNYAKNFKLFPSLAKCPLCELFYHRKKHSRLEKYNTDISKNLTSTYSLSDSSSSSLNYEIISYVLHRSSLYDLDKGSLEGIFNISARSHMKV